MLQCLQVLTHAKRVFRGSRDRPGASPKPWVTLTFEDGARAWKAAGLVQLAIADLLKVTPMVTDGVLKACYVCGANETHGGYHTASSPLCPANGTRAQSPRAADSMPKKV